MNTVHSRNEVAEMLLRHKITPTHQRIEIAYALFSGPQHLPADEVMAMVNQRHPVASKATVYNTLNLFLKKGLIREVIVDPNKVFYDRNTSEHHHFYDVVSGSLSDIDATDISVSGLPALPEGAVIEGVDIVVRIRPKTV